MSEISVDKKIADKQQLRDAKKQLLKAIRENNSREWKSIVDLCDGVYVYRSPITDNTFDGTIKVCKVTVVGLVKKCDDGTYQLQIGWSKCHFNDTFNRKVGNIIAARRANNPEMGMDFDGYYDVRPMVLKGFATNLLKKNFIQIASSIVSNLEETVDRETGEPITYNLNSEFLNRQAGYYDYAMYGANADFDI